MADFLREMDPAHRAFLVIFIVTVLHGIMLAWWGRFKTAENRKPVTMKLRNGVHVPWGRIEKIQRVVNIAVVLWLVYIGVLLAALAYMKLMGWERLF